MGLLDDAIREHLELKRRRGADPGEVAREQREVLDVVPEASPEALGTTSPEGSPRADGPLQPASADVGPGGVVTDGDVEAAPVPAEPSATLGETAELDMSSVLGDDTHPPVAAAPGAEEDSLEWEVPADAVEEQQPEEQAEDVLEETPEFLRDTPEQDRLWFEQRPPRDFDFDK